MEAREKIAELEHIQWQDWARVRSPDHPLLDVPYMELTKEQKDQDRIYADRVLDLKYEDGSPMIAILDKDQKDTELEHLPYKETPAEQPFVLGQRRMRTRMKAEGWRKVVNDD